jgi:hypothetical protein
MNLLSYVSLRHMLTLPYVVLLLMAAAIIGWLSYTAGNEAVDTLSDTVVTETVGRITQAVDKHIAGSEAVLETAFPPDIAARSRCIAHAILAGDLDQSGCEQLRLLREQQGTFFWIVA